MGDAPENLRTVILSNNFSENAVIVNTVGNNPIPIFAGGFAGRIRGNVSFSYATGDVSVLGFSGISAGGFVGEKRWGGGSNNNFASGNVTVVHRPTSASDVHAGGFAGRAVDILNSYARGNVFVDSSVGGAVNAGGLVGSNLDTRVLIDHSFSSGIVIANSTAGVINVGGLLGLATAGVTGHNIRRSAVLPRGISGSLSVTATGGTDSPPRNIGRIFGGAPANAAIVNNHAFNGMQIFQHATSGTPRELITPTVPTSGDDLRRHGTDANLGTFRSRTLWQTTLDFSNERWDFSTVENLGHPVLRASLNGPRMGGQ